MRYEFPEFDAHFPNQMLVLDQLRVPSQDEIRREPLNLSWCPIDEAMEKMGPCGRSVVKAMMPHLQRKKRYAFVDLKLQYFKAGDSPVDSLHWHCDGTIWIEDERSAKLGYVMLHDMYARLNHPSPPTYLMYHTADFCATQFVAEPLTLRIPKCIPGFQEFDRLVNSKAPAIKATLPGQIVAFDGFSIHRAVPAKKDGWRLWIRVKETDHFTAAKASAREYGAVFRQAQ